MRKIGLLSITPSTFNLSESIKEIVKKREYRDVFYLNDSSFTCQPDDFIETECLNSKYIQFISNKLKNYNKDIIGLQVFDNDFKQEDIGLFSAISSMNAIVISTAYIKSDIEKVMKHRIIVTLLHELGECMANLLGYTHFTLVFANHNGDCVFHPRSKRLFEWIRKDDTKFMANYKDSLPEYYCPRCSEIIQEGLELWHEI